MSLKKSHWGGCVKSRESLSLTGGSDFQLKVFVGFSFVFPLLTKKGNKYTSKLISLSSLLLYSKNKL